MKPLFTSILVFTVLYLNPLFAETITVSGDVSGTWSADTVLVQDEIRIPQYEMLIIEPGVRVIFEGHYKFIVDTGAVLQALGSASDSIHFQATNPVTSWHGIRFYSAGDTCAFAYCAFCDGYAYEGNIPYQDQYGGAVYMRSTTLHLHNCRFTQNRAKRRGGGIYAVEGSIINIRECRFVENSCINLGSPVRGGAIYANESNLHIHESEFIDNLLDGHGGTTSGGAIDCSGGELFVYNCLFQNNDAITIYSNPHGGAIATSGVIADISNCFFEENSAPAGTGGAIYCSDETVISKCDFFENSAWRGGAVSCHGRAVITNSTFNGNVSTSYAGAIRCGYQTDVSIVKCTICRNVTGGVPGGTIHTGNFSDVNIRNTIFEGNVNYAIGVNGLTTYRVDYCAFYNNQGGDFTYPGVPQIGTIFEDPRLSDPDNRDFTLLPASPCIDLGDPNLPADPDDSRSDIGAFYYDHTGQVGIRGECTLSNLTNHQGSKVYFSEPGGALIDSSQTFNNDKFRLFVDPGIYDLSFTHFGYDPEELLNQNCTEPIALPAVNLTYSTQLIHISGGLSGMLETADYIADDNLRVTPGDSLIIEPGTKIYFDGDYKFEVHGYLSACGTEEDSIFFLPAEGVDHWQGIDITAEASDSILFEYCFISDSWSSGIDITGTGLSLEHCTVTNNSAFSGGGGIRCYEGSIYITTCTIRGNDAMINPQVGGGIYCYYGDCFIQTSIIDNNLSDDGGGGFKITYGNHAIVDCIIEDNITGGGGGGIAITNSSGIISNSSISHNIGGGILGPDTVKSCLISYNEAYWGGGISSYGSDSYIESCIIAGNYVVDNGAGVYLDDPATLKNCLILDNHAGFSGGGVFVGYNSDPRIISCTIANNIADYRDGGFAVSGECYPIITNCIHWGNIPPEIYRWPNTPPEMSVSFSTFEDTLFSGPGNITDDPLFVDPLSGDFHLQSITGSYHGGAWLPDPNHSPCIDSGDPTSAFIFEPVPNGERINMGAYGNTPEASLSAIDLAVQQEAMLPSANYLDANSPNPFNPMTTIRYGLSRTSNVKITIYDVAGRLVTTLADGHRDAGIHEIAFNAENLASGIYIYRLEAGQFSASGKMVLMK